MKALASGEDPYAHEQGAGEADNNGPKSRPAKKAKTVKGKAVTSKEAKETSTSNHLDIEEGKKPSEPKKRGHMPAKKKANTATEKKRKAAEVADEAEDEAHVEVTIEENEVKGKDASGLPISTDDKPKNRGRMAKRKPSGGGGHCC